MQRFERRFSPLIVSMLLCAAGVVDAAPVSIWIDTPQYAGAGANECQTRGTVSFRDHYRQVFDKKFSARWGGRYQLQPGEDTSNGLDDGLHVSNIQFSANTVDTRLFHFQRHYALQYDLVYFHEGKIAFMTSLGRNGSVLSPEEFGSQSGCEAQRRKFASALDSLIDASLDELASSVAAHPQLAAALNGGSQAVASAGKGAPVVSGAYRVGAGGLIVHKTASAKGARVETLAAGSEVVVKARRSGGWVQLERDGRVIGWAHPGAHGLVASQGG
jgi:hypothetical protein